MPPLPLAAALHAELPWVSRQSRAVLTALAASNGNIASADHLAAMAALRNRFQLARLLRSEGLPTVERLAAWTRVLHWISQGEAVGCPLSRLATRSGMAPATAYRLVKRLTGARWSVARRRGLAHWLQYFATACGTEAAPHRGDRDATRCESGHAEFPHTLTPRQARRCAVCRTPVPAPPPSRLVEAAIPIPGQPYDVACLSRRLAYVTCGHGGVVREVDLRTRRVTATISVGSVPTRIVLGPRSKRAYVSNQFSQTIGVIDVSTRRMIDEIGVSGDPAPMAVDGAERVLHVATNEDCLFAIDLASRRVQDAIALPATSSHVTLHPRRGALYVSTRAAGVILELSVAPYLVTRRWDVKGITQSLVITRDGRTAFVANEVGRVDVIDLIGGRVTARIGLGQVGAFGIALSPTESELYVSLTLSGLVKAYDARTLKPRGSIVVGGQPREMTFERSSGTLLVANEVGWLSLVRHCQPVPRTPLPVEWNA